ncbi:DNA repair protein RecN [Bryobacter aggregatus]|uniref:DNA repair protein RecN n=1 Tax=Bryobacter aggregatus TaxID=360054 RepID=UPI0004E189AC|nr:DNA repair protein RecN [Bryobacter aggregatus]
MLVELLVENFAVADRVRIRLHAGLNVLSGETGSGKSLLVDSLGLLFGGRASTEVIRSGADRARIAGIFEAPKKKALSALLDEAGIELEDGELLIEREILANGKSRAFIGSKPVSASFLKQLQPWLGDIHGQHDQQRLFNMIEQRLMLDEYAGNETLLERIATLFTALRAAESELAQIDAREQELLRQRDIWSFQKTEIESANLKPGEDTGLDQELRILANVVKLKEQAGGAYEALQEGPESAMSMLIVATKRIAELKRIDENLHSVLENLRTAEASIDEASRELSSYVENLEADPGRLAFVEARIAEIDKLRRKYGSSVEEILSFYAKVSADLALIEGADERRDHLRSEIKKLQIAYGTAAAELTVRRRKAAEKLEKKVEGELKDLNMERSRFVIAVQESSWSATGADEVAFLISTNLGEEPKPLEKVASGGELSRLALALKVSLAASGQRTMVFDEVDAGIGGSAAEQVGKKLKALAASNQLLCVTHLAQIAAFADHHFLVEKREAKGRTHSVIEELEGPARVKEIARMIGGQRLTDEAVRYADQLLQMGATA